MGAMALTFLVASLVHLGLRLPLGSATLTEPRIIPAAVVEGICGLALMRAAWSLFSRQPGAWLATVVGLLVAVAGVALGIFALALGRGRVRQQAGDQGLIRGHHVLTKPFKVSELLRSMRQAWRSWDRSEQGPGERTRKVTQVTTDNSQKAQPSPALKRLEKLVGTWTIAGRTLDSDVDNIKGRVVINWLAGGFFLEQRGEMEFMGTRIESLEIVYYDPTADTFPSTVYASIGGTPLPYRFDVRGNAVTHSEYSATFYRKLQRRRTPPHRPHRRVATRREHRR